MENFVSIIQTNIVDYFSKFQKEKKIKLYFFSRIKGGILIIQVTLKKLCENINNIFSEQKRTFFHFNYKFCFKQPKCSQQNTFCCFNQFLSLNVFTYLIYSDALLRTNAFLKHFMFLQLFRSVHFLL